MRTHSLLGALATPALVLALASPAPAAEKSEDRPPAAGEPDLAAGWQICNEASHNTVYVAYAVKQGDDWMAIGWREITPGACAKILDTLDNRYVYYYANAADGTIWSGDKQLCVHPTDAFQTVVNTTCAPGYELRGFITVDTGDYKGFTSRLTD